MRQILSAERPADGIIGEEYGNERPTSARQWVLDPIDGTTSFVAGRPIFGTLIALLDKALARLARSEKGEIAAIIRLPVAP